jgi:hypothetical protein
MAADDLRYSMEEAVIAQMALRRAAGVPVDALELPAFMDAIRGEIDGLCNAGFADDEIAAVIERAIRRPIAPEVIGQCRPRQWPAGLAAVTGIESA